MLSHIHQTIDIIWLTLMTAWVISAFDVKPSAQIVELRLRAAQLLFIGCACVLLFTEHPQFAFLEARVFPVAPAVVGTGIAVTAVAAAFAIVARLYLGRNWSATPRIARDHDLVCGGPYRLVRHPIYTGMLVASLGTAIAFGQVRHLFALPLLIVGFWLAARAEERLLLSEFGDRYVAYRLDVRGAIIPYVL
jgi:protein-S-isoprenylcysteine O-methyltransferase